MVLKNIVVIILVGVIIFVLFATNVYMAQNDNPLSKEKENCIGGCKGWFSFFKIEKTWSEVANHRLDDDYEIDTGVIDIFKDEQDVLNAESEKPFFNLTKNWLSYHTRSWVYNPETSKYELKPKK